ncbi:hypothetical protein M8818_004476 [Zalaria obscura]|uniref:Uncharacterized protein n=1 Tax=Zalaria obscura TaxID=2024903 RepID=A0ACC3SC56_9PEZI
MLPSPDWTTLSSAWKAVYHVDDVLLSHREGGSGVGGGTTEVHFSSVWRRGSVSIMVLFGPKRRSDAGTWRLAGTSSLGFACHMGEAESVDDNLYEYLRSSATFAATAGNSLSFGAKKPA